MDDKKSVLTNLPALVTATGGLITAVIALMSFMSSPAPTINSFDATPNIIGLGESSTLKWAVTGNGASVTIDPDIGTVALSGSREVTPANNTSYVLTARNKDAEKTATVTVVVGPARPEENSTDESNAVAVEPESSAAASKSASKADSEGSDLAEVSSIPIQEASTESSAPALHAVASSSPESAASPHSDLAEVSSPSSAASSSNAASKSEESDLAEVSSSSGAASTSEESDLAEVSSPSDANAKPAESDLAEVSSSSAGFISVRLS
jgi:hypothetical protein